MPPAPSNPAVQFTCSHPQCGKAYSAQSTLAAHVNSVHNGHRWSCNACNPPRNFADRSNWQRHQRKHRQDRFACHLCAHSDRRIDNFKRHLSARHRLSTAQIGNCVRLARLPPGATAAAAAAPVSGLPSLPVVPPVEAEIPSVQQQRGVLRGPSASSFDAISTCGTSGDEAQQGFYDPLSFGTGVGPSNFALDFPAREVADWLPSGDNIPEQYSFGDDSFEDLLAPLGSAAPPNGPFTAVGQDAHLTLPVEGFRAYEEEMSFDELLAGMGQFASDLETGDFLLV